MIVHISVACIVMMVVDEGGQECCVVQGVISHLPELKELGMARYSCATLDVSSARS